MPDTNVVLTVPLLGVHVLAACRVVEVVDEKRQVGFASRYLRAAEQLATR